VLQDFTLGLCGADYLLAKKSNRVKLRWLTL
jgi:hypothetical protein